MMSFPNFCMSCLPLQQHQALLIKQDRNDKISDHKDNVRQSTANQLD